MTKKEQERLTLRLKYAGIKIIDPDKLAKARSVQDDPRDRDLFNP